MYSYTVVSGRHWLKVRFNAFLLYAYIMSIVKGILTLAGVLLLFAALAGAAAVAVYVVPIVISLVAAFYFWKEAAKDLTRKSHGYSSYSSNRSTQKREPPSAKYSRKQISGPSPSHIAKDGARYFYTENSDDRHTYLTESEEFLINQMKICGYCWPKSHLKLAKIYLSDEPEMALMCTFIAIKQGADVMDSESALVDELKTLHKELVEELGEEISKQQVLKATEWIKVNNPPTPDDPYWKYA